jgi:hypothetical protein
MAKDLKMCPDPKCAKESPADAEVCIGCGVHFETFNMLDTVLGIRERRAQAEAEKNKPTKKQSILDSLTRKK